MKPELVLSKHPINSEGNEATSTLDNKKSNVIAVLPEMSEIQGMKYSYLPRKSLSPCHPHPFLQKLQETTF